MVMNTERDGVWFSDLVPDGEGGAWVLWSEGMMHPHWLEKAYVQRIDGEGKPVLGENGLRLSPRE